MSNVNPLVCICVPTYNAESTIKESLESILAQSYSNLIIHISDNASTDDTLEVVRSINDPRLHIHTHQENIGGEGNFTRCIQMAEGDYTAIFHADDVYETTIVEKEVLFLESNKNTCAVLTFATEIDSKGSKLKTYLAPKSLGMRAGESKSYDIVALFKSVLQHDNFLFCPSAMIRTSVCISEIKVWRGEQFKSSADLDVWLRLAALNHLGLLNEPLLFYRISDAQETADYRRNREGFADTFLVLNHWLNDERISRNITEDDLVNYKKLQRNDLLGRILNAVRSGDLTLAHKLWRQKPYLSILIMWKDMKSQKDLKFIMLALLLRLMLLPILGTVFKFTLLVALKKVRL